MASMNRIGFVAIAGPDARAEAEGRRVRDLDRLVGIAHAEDRRHRAERLLAAAGAFDGMSLSTVGA